MLASSRRGSNRLRGALIVAVLAASMLVASAAYAHVVKDEVNIYENNNACIRSLAEVSHGNGGQGYFRTRILGKKPFNTTLGQIACYTNWQRPADAYRGRMLIYKWATNSSGQWGWQLCVATSWGQSGQNWTGVEWIRHAQDTWGGPPCGFGEYMTQSGNYYRDHAWVLKGPIYTHSNGYHWLPS